MQKNLRIHTIPELLAIGIIMQVDKVVLQRENLGTYNFTEL